jgi:hypothetical protein
MEMKESVTVRSVRAVICKRPPSNLSAGTATVVSMCVSDNCLPVEGFSQCVRHFVVAKFTTCLIYPTTGATREKARDRSPAQA